MLFQPRIQLPGRGDLGPLIVGRKSKRFAETQRVRLSPVSGRSERSQSRAVVYKYAARATEWEPICARPCVADKSRAAPGHGQGHQNGPGSAFLEVPSWLVPLACRAARRGPTGPAAPHQVAGQMTIHDNTAVDCR